MISCKPLLMMMISNQIRHCLVDKLIIVQVAIKFLTFYAISKVINKSPKQDISQNYMNPLPITCRTICFNILLKKKSIYTFPS